MGDVPKAPLPQAPLMPFDATGRTEWAIPFAFEDYLELVDWTGRAVHPSKKGVIAAGQPNILERIGGDGETFITFATRFLKEFGSAVGAPSALIALCARRQIKYLRGIRTARRMFGRLELQLGRLIGQIGGGHHCPRMVSMVTQPDGFGWDFDHVACWTAG